MNNEKVRKWWQHKVMSDWLLKREMTSLSDSWDLHQDWGLCPKRQVNH